VGRTGVYRKPNDPRPAHSAKEPRQLELSVR
jgi:hypothetical protein